ncbi:MAG: glycoside hydrolase family 57 protein [Thermoprotei archaeon]|nr:alpha-amylase [TACK group archaeon]
MKVVLAFEVHQPRRIKRDFFWSDLMGTHPKIPLLDFYFDRESDKEIFLRASKKAYTPTNDILLDLIDRQKGDPRGLRVAFGISGLFLEQCEEYDPDLLESFRQLVKTGRVEIMEETYYHSLASLYDDMDEFDEQIQQHRKKVKELLNFEPRFFENTELIYNDQIANHVSSLGYSGIFAEGAERILGWRSPNYVYLPKGNPNIKVLFRNYRLSDDVAFRFSARWWTEWPLTADKYADWLSRTSGQYVGLFMDYETFGEHQWPETGIHDFLRSLPYEVLKHENLRFATPSEVVKEEDPVDEITVPPNSTTSWADIERDTSCWLGNAMQWAYFRSLQKIGRELKGYNGPEGEVWRYFQESDIPYYMYTYGGGPGEVHNYFSPYPSPYDAAVTGLSALWDLEQKIRQTLRVADHPFVFTLGGNPVGQMAYTLEGMISVLDKVPEQSLREHMKNGDLSRWMRDELGLSEAAAKLESIDPKSLYPREELRSALKAILKP